MSDPSIIPHTKQQSLQSGSEVLEVVGKHLGLKHEGERGRILGIFRKRPCAEVEAETVST